MDSAKPTLRREEIKEIKRETSKTLVEIKYLLRIADYMGIRAERERGKRIIKYALKTSKEGYHWEALDALREARNFLKELVDKRMEEEIIDLSFVLDDLEGGGRSKKIMNTISKLEKARDEEEYEDVPELIFKAWEAVKKK